MSDDPRIEGFDADHGTDVEDSFEADGDGERTADAEAVDDDQRDGVDADGDEDVDADGDEDVDDAEDADAAGGGDTDGPDGGPRVEGFDPDELGATDAPWVDDAVGLRWDLLSADRVEAHVEAGEQHHQPYGIVHGGVYSSIVETLASVAAAIHAAPDGKVVVGVSNTTDFLRPHRDGRLDAVAIPLHRGRLQHLWVVEIRRGDEKLVARGQVRLQVLDPEAIGAPAPGAATDHGDDDGDG